MNKPWEEIINSCLTCKKCDLCKTRTNVVFGVGNPEAEVVFIGEGPGEQEDLQGVPFVGRSGQLLDKMLQAIGLYRDKNIYIANIVKCRPPENRDPLPDEQKSCMEWLNLQLDFIKPKIIVTLGRIAAMKFINPNIKITKEHGVFYEKDGVTLMATLHPAALLRNPLNKPMVFQDFLNLRNEIQTKCNFTYK
jgi:uracil-DNA glycosylase, family 4